jgi:Phosphotransferase enzyme family
MSPLPRTVEGITLRWLNEALRSRHPGITVRAMRITNIIWGTSTKVLVELDYAGDGAADGIAHQLCIKGEFDEKLRQSLTGVVTTGTQIEADFYNDLAPRLGVPVARYWYAGSEPGMGILILDNLSALDYRFGTPTEPWTPELVAKALDILAVLHATTWGKSFPEVPWLVAGSEVLRGYTEFLQSEAHWKEQFARPGAFQLHPYLADRERSLAGLRAMWRYDTTHAHCVVHGDAHLGNTCIDPGGNPFFIDWAAPCFNHWAIDVAYFVTGAMSVADRRHTERDLLAHYLDRLAAHGGPVLDRGEAWDDYRRHLIHGMNWGVLPPTMQSQENVHAMGERHGVAMVEHDTLRLLGV